VSTVFERLTFRFSISFHFVLAPCSRIIFAFTCFVFALTFIMPAKAKAPVFTSGCDLRDFVRQFDRYLSLSGVNENAHPLRLQHLSVALPTDLFKLLELEITTAAADATFSDVTSRFLLAAGATPPDAATELAAFDAALPRPDEALSAFAGRLAVLASTAFAILDAAGRALMIKRRFTSALATTHPAIYRTIELQQPATVAEAVKLATTHVRVDAMIAVRAIGASSSSQVATPPSATACPAASASATTITATQQAPMAQASSSAAASLNQRQVDELLGHLRAFSYERRGRFRGSYNQSRGRRGMAPSFDNRPYSRGDFNQQDRNDRNEDRNDHRNSNRRQQTNDRDRRYSRSSSAPPQQCFSCSGFGHFARDCPNGTRPDRF
jgi:hypothetical protein